MADGHQHNESYRITRKNADEIRFEAIVQSSQMVSLLGAAIKNPDFDLSEEWLHNTGEILIGLGQHIDQKMDEGIALYYERQEALKKTG